MNCDEAEELITALVDRALPDPDAASLEAHLKGCANCRGVLHEERALKQATRRLAERVRAPESLRAKILSDARIFPQRSRPASLWRDFLWPTSLVYRRVLEGAVAVALLLAAFYFLSPKEEPFAVAALETYGLTLKTELPTQRAAKPDEIAEQLTQAVGGRFHPMGYDFSEMGLLPVSGLVREIQGRKVLLAIYKGRHGAIICYTFLGGEEDAPPNAASFFDPAKKIKFFAFSSGPVNAVFHREGELICILASKMPMDELFALAKSKAKPS